MWTYPSSKLYHRQNVSCQQRQAIVHHVKEWDVEDEGIEILLLLFAINVTDVCPGTAFIMLTSATVQRQRLTSIVPQVVYISFGGHRGVYIEG